MPDRVLRHIEDMGGPLFWIFVVLPALLIIVGIPCLTAYAIAKVLA